jgi:cytosine/adenosine deaminase-related metal-dependent hydrolase
MVRALGFANQRHLPVSLHCGAFGTPTDDQIRFLDDQKFLTPSCTLVHADTLSDDSYRRIAAGGAYLSVSAESESGYGQGYPAVVKAVQLGVPWSLSIDNISQLSGDMYTAMRATLIADHLEEHREAHQQGQQLTGLRLRSSDVLVQATIGGARALGLDAVTGSITPGKAADLVLLRPDTLAMTPAADPIGSTVHQAGRGDVDTVLVGGQLCKFRGELVGVDVGHARQLMQQTFSYLRSRITDADWAQAINPT